MYRKVYYADTRDLNEVPLLVEIYKDTDTYTPPVELYLSGDEPIVIKYDGDSNIFKPVMQSSATINVVTDEPLLDMYTGQLNDVYVKIFRDGVLFWYGFLTPNVYSQEYEACLNEFQLEFIDTLAHLEDIKFEQIGYFQSFYQYISNVIDRIDTQKVIDGFVFQDNLPIDIKTMGVLERNFIDETADEDEGAMTCREVLESIMMWIGKTMFYFKNKLYMIDFTHPTSGATLYDRTTAQSSPYQLDMAVQDLLEIGINGAACNISLGDVYNKVNIIANTNQIDNTIPNILDDNVLVSAMPENVDYIETTFVSRRVLNEGETDADRTYTRINAFFVNPQWKMPNGYYERHTEEVYPEGDYTDIYNDNVNVPVINGMMWYIGNVNTGYLWKMYSSTVHGGYKLANDGRWIVNAPIDINTGDDMTGQPWEESFLIGDPSIDWKILHEHTENVISSSNIEDVAASYVIQKYADYSQSAGEPSTLNWKTVLTMGDLLSKAILSYGYYGDGDFQDSTAIQLATDQYFIGKGGYFIFSMSYYFSNAFLYANTSPYTFPPETYGKCLPYADASTDCTFREDRFQIELRIGNKYFNGTDWVTTPSKFIVTHRNVYGDNVFGNERSIDNTVSYKYGLAKSKDGYAIPLPNDSTVEGKLSFKIYPDTRLGGIAQIPQQGVIPEHGDSGWQYDGYLQNCSPILSIHVTKLELIYTTKDTVEDVYNLQTYDPDIVYTNVIDERYITQLDDIELTTNTYSPHAVSYSYVIQSGTTGFDYVSEVSGVTQEERLVEKYVNHYKNPKLRYENNLNAQTITPYSIVRILSLDKQFIANGVEYDLAANRAKTNLIEFE